MNPASVLVRRGLSMKTMTVAVSALVFSLTVGCTDSQPPAPGPAEETGRQIDKAMESAGEKTRAALDEAQHYASDKIDEAGKALEQAGKRLQE